MTENDPAQADLPPLKLRSRRRVLMRDVPNLRRPPKPPKPKQAKVPREREDGEREREHRPLYWRMLGLHHVQPNGWLRALFVEGALALGVVLALAEAASIWTIVALPVSVAVLVKANDLIAGVLSGNPSGKRRREH
jgi:hypothetical protein